MPNNNFIYLDNNATTPLDPKVLEVMMPYLTDMYGNASSSHRMGKQLKKAVDRARGQMGDLIDVNAEDIYFTAGATEAINLALQGLPEKNGKSKHIITVKTEHPAVLDTCRYLETIGVEVTYLSVNSFGLIDFAELKDAFKDSTVLVCVMHVNNETGVIQDIEAIADIAHENGALFMTDGTQAVGKLPIEASDYIDVLTFSAHKFYGPKGIGGLYVNPRIKLKTMLYGGGHERGLRSGTLNVPGIVGLGKAAEVAQYDMLPDSNRIARLRDILETQLLKIEGAYVNGSKGSRIYNTSNMRFERVDNDALLMVLNEICVSNGSACHSFVMEPSHVLLSMGCSTEQANTAIRFSLGRFNTGEEVKQTIAMVQKAVVQLRSMAC
ncbi:cysteine desulfurase [Sphingobacterium sp. lm-10]|uniref:cysteine desulfurase family protein n=1 Tax=Sphingobacterium sp. lm-10 TaxID=2944904 RepID=UPI00201FF869|nr:cysteine desulfurase family protein [Sphingobacterium sp. lm-10]MCL7987099.1 cysteine desulfurase [Sphingobacterium sp. lm-10]